MKYLVDQQDIELIIYAYNSFDNIKNKLEFESTKDNIKLSCDIDGDRRFTTIPSSFDVSEQFDITELSNVINDEDIGFFLNAMYTVIKMPIRIYKKDHTPIIICDNEIYIRMKDKELYK